MKSIYIAVILSGIFAGCAQPRTTVTSPPGETERCRGGECSDDNGQNPSNPNPTNPIFPPDFDNSPDLTIRYSTGATARFLPESSGAFSEMFYNSLPNAPSDVTINIDLNRPYEEIIIYYRENNEWKEAAFSTTHPFNSSVQNDRYNGWVNQGSQPVWKGFFQDYYGAIVLIIDSAISQGDGAPPNLVGGTIYFQNFTLTRMPDNCPQTYSIYAPDGCFYEHGSLKMCWEITRGPYDCRTFLEGNSINMTSSLYPENWSSNPYIKPYKKLGTFIMMDRAAAGF